MPEGHPQIIWRFLFGSTGLILLSIYLKKKKNDGMHVEK